MALLDLNLGSSGNNKGARVVYDEDQNRFVVRNVNHFLRCLCGGCVSGENERTWNVFMETLQQQHGITPGEIPNRHVDWSRMRESGENLTRERFDSLVEWADCVHELRSATESIEEDESNPTEEPAAPVEKPVEKAEAAARRMLSPEFAYLKSPALHHDPDSVYFQGIPPAGAPNGSKIRKFRENLSKKTWHTLASDPVSQRDADQIRREKIQPNEAGLWVVKGTGENPHAYRLHGQEPNTSLFPVEIEDGSPSVVTFTGAALDDLLSQYEREKTSPAKESLSFGQFVRRRAKPSDPEEIP